MADFFSILYLILFCQGFFLGILLFWLGKNNGKKHLYFVCTLVLCISFQLLIYGLSYNELILKVPHLAGLEAPIPFLYGPLLYFIFKYSDPQFKLDHKSLLHLLPFVIYVLYRSDLYFLSGQDKHFILEQSLTNTQNLVRSIPLSSYMVKLLITTHLIFYFFKCNSLINSMKEKERDEGIFEHKFSFQLKILKGYLLYIGFFISYSTILLSGLGFYNILCYITKCFMAFSIYYIGYAFIINKDFGEQLAKITKYKNSPLSNDVKEHIWNEVNSYLKNRDVFRSPNLRLADVSQDLGYPVHYISQIINEKSGYNFSAFVNLLRIEYAKKELVEKKDIKISDLVLDSGFNSKSSFYTEFKKCTGLTPVEFKKY